MPSISNTLFRSRVGFRTQKYMCSRIVEFLDTRRRWLRFLSLNTAIFDLLKFSFTLDNPRTHPKHDL